MILSSSDTRLLNENNDVNKETKTVIDIVACDVLIKKAVEINICGADYIKDICGPKHKLIMMLKEPNFENSFHCLQITLSIGWLCSIEFVIGINTTDHKNIQ